MNIKTCIKLATFGLLLPAAWMSQTLMLSGAEVLNGFAINTKGKSVTVTLYGDQPLQYTTEKQEKQFTITLPNAQISKQQMDEGLPVVIDNENRFIGRAVPTEDGRVKIILPNIPTKHFSVSVQQPGVKPKPSQSNILQASTLDSIKTNTPVNAAQPKIAPAKKSSAPGSTSETALSVDNTPAEHYVAYKNPRPASVNAVSDELRFTTDDDIPEPEAVNAERFTLSKPASHVANTQALPQKVFRLKSQNPAIASITPVADHTEPKTEIKIRTSQQSLQPKRLVTPDPISIALRITPDTATMQPIALVSVENSGKVKHLAPNENPANPASLPNGITPPGTIWNPYVVKIPAASIPKESKAEAVADNSGMVVIPNGRNLYSAPAPGFPPQFTPAVDPMGNLQALSQQGQFSFQPPVFPSIPPAANTAAAPSSTDTKNATDTKKSAATPTSVTKTVAVERTQTSDFLSSPIVILDHQLPSPMEFLWLAAALFFGGVGTFSVLGVLLISALVLSQRLRSKFFSHFSGTASDKTASITVVESSNKAETQNPESSRETDNLARIGLKKSAKVFTPGDYGKKYGSLGFSDSAVINALDYTNVHAPTLSAAIQQNWQNHFGWQAPKDATTGQRLVRPATMTERFLKTGNS